MSYFGDTYTTNIKPQLQDWLTNTDASKNVSDLPLDLANRAQKNLWAKKAWSNLIVRVSLSLTNASYTFPADFGRIVDMWADLAGQGVATYWFYEADNYEKGYRLDAGFTKAAGYSRSITFHYAQQSSAYMRYQKVLSNFTGEGTEYSYFPANLVLLEAQRINALEKGNMKEFSALSTSFNEVFQDFSNTTQWVNYDPSPRLNDRLGNEIYTENYSLSGESSRPFSVQPNSFIV